MALDVILQICAHEWIISCSCAWVHNYRVDFSAIILIPTLLHMSNERIHVVTPTHDNSLLSLDNFHTVY